MNKENTITKIAIFQKKEIRKIIYQNEWWFSVADVIEALTDTVNIRDYIKKMRKRDKELDTYWGTKCPLLEMIAKDGRKREITSANTCVRSSLFDLTDFAKFNNSIYFHHNQVKKTWLNCEVIS